MSWISGIADKIKSRIAKLREDPIGDAVDAAHERIEALTMDEARRECLTTLHGAARFQASERAWQAEGMDLPPSVVDIFRTFEWISFSGDEIRLDRSLVAVEQTNSDFIIIGSDMELGSVYVYRGKEGVFTGSSFAGITGEHPWSSTLYHFLLEQIWLYGERQ